MAWEDFLRTPESHKRWDAEWFMFMWLYTLFGGAWLAALMVSYWAAVSQGWGLFMVWVGATLPAGWAVKALASVRAFHKRECEW